MTQGVLDFTSPSPINIARLSGQNLRLYEFFMRGNRIHVFSPAKLFLKIGYLNSRVSDLRNKHHLPIEDHTITAADVNGEAVTVKEYWMNEAYLKNLKNGENS